MHSLKVSFATSPVGMIMVIMLMMALLPLCAWSAPAPVNGNMPQNPNVVYERFVRRRPQLNQYNQEVFEIREIFYRPTPKIRLLEDDEMDSIIRCDFDTTLSECENLIRQKGITIRTTTSKSNIEAPTTTTTTTTTTTNKPQLSIITTTTSTTTTDWPHLPELSEEELLAEDQDVQELDRNAIDTDDNDYNDSDNDADADADAYDGVEENEEKNHNKQEETLINEDIIEENNIGDLLRPHTSPPELSDFEDIDDQDAIDDEDRIESNNLGNADDKFDLNARIDGNEKNENDEDDEINDEIDNGILADYHSEEDGAMGYLDLTAQKK